MAAHLPEPPDGPPAADSTDDQRAPPATELPRGLIGAAALCAAVVIASQLAGKAARDAIFLERFPVTRLPVLLAISSALAIGTTFLFARRLARNSPVRVVQATNVVSALLLVVEWSLLERFPRPIATTIYIHQTLLGPILVSGFWSIISESFDPRTARRVVGTIGSGATIGGFAGALLAERVAALLGTEAILPTVASLQLFASWRLGAIGRGRAAQPTAPTSDPTDEIAGTVTSITHVSLLRRLAAITVIVTVAAALLDFVFKSMAASQVTRRDDLARLFATFHGVVGVTTALVQWLFGRWALQSWGLARTLATLPGAVIVFGVVALVMPGVGTFVALRGAENVLRNSLYREAYEVFYTPLMADERRATKTVIDVGVERFGDVLGGVLVIVLIGSVAAPTTTLLACAIGLAILGAVVALRAQHSYVEALERSLVAHAIDLPTDELPDLTTRTTLEQVARGAPPRASASGRWFQRTKGKREPIVFDDLPALEPRLARLADLASGDADRLRRALDGPPLPPSAIHYVLPLLARPELEQCATANLLAVAHRSLGQLVDALRDPQLPVAVRCRIPGIIATRALEEPYDAIAARSARSSGEIARAGLLACLDDPELEIRYRTAEALLVLREREPDLAFDDAIVFDGVRRELALDPAVWTALDVASSEAVHSSARLHSRAAQHLSTLLALALPAEPIRAAFQGLWSEDPAHRGVALEYLENVLPDDIRDRIWMVLAIESPQRPASKRSIEEVLADLLQPRRTHAQA